MNDFRLERRGSTTFLVVAVAAYAWVAAGLRPFTLAEEVLVAIPAVLALVLATRTSGTRRTDSPDTPSRGSVMIWLALVVVAAGWELRAYFSSPRSAHPTLSVIADEVMSVRPGRALTFALWLVLGWVLVRGSASGTSLTSRTVTFAGFAAILCVTVLWTVLTARHPRWLTLPGAIASLTRRRGVRIAVVLGWVWLGWHLFARGSGAFE